MTPPLFYPNFGMFPLDQIADVGVSLSKYLKLFSREIIFLPEVLNDPNRPTDRRTDELQWHRCALVASRGKNTSYYYNYYYY